MSPKKFGKSILCWLLERQVRQLRRRHHFQLVAVAGSVGKTSTKLAIVKTLAGSKRVIYQDGNYNDRLTVPLILFNQTEPGLYDLAAWLKILLANRRLLKGDYPYDMAIVELGADGPDQLIKFAYLEPELTVITAVADEHMEYFKTLDAVAKEELTPLQFSKQNLLNTDDISGRYLSNFEFSSYGLEAGDYRIGQRQSFGLQGQKLTFQLPGGKTLAAQVPMLGDQGAKIVLAAVAVADLLGLTTDEIRHGLASIKPVAGRLQVLAGKNNSVILDDSYNASPPSALAALQVLQTLEAPQRIAILGNMNELGEDSQTAHQTVGAACDPKKINLVVTIGQLAKDNLALAAAKRGCQTMSFNTPLEAGNYVATQTQKGAVILVKGSQNGVFAEEAIKPLLAKPADATKLVRQSAYWMNIKRRQFPDLRAKAN